MTTPKISWDHGTAYDLFQSLTVLHFPNKFSVRGAWTAGMRARLSTASRETLERAQRVIHIPLHWVHGLEEPKDAETALWSLGRIPPADRLPTLAFYPEDPRVEVKDFLLGVAKRGASSDEDVEHYKELFQCNGGGEKRPPGDEHLRGVLEVWANAEAFGEALLEALRDYRDAFFGEEEKRIAPALVTALERARGLADRLALSDLLEELSQGIRIDVAERIREITLVPSYWITPLMMYATLGPDRALFLFGARPPDASLIPGETVPDTLLRAVKALCDPTRLKILRYLAEEPRAPTQLTRRLRLRTPTVMHHLHALRLAGLIQVTLDTQEKKQCKEYALRPNALDGICEMIKGYIGR